MKNVKYYLQGVFTGLIIIILIEIFGCTNSQIQESQQSRFNNAGHWIINADTIMTKTDSSIIFYKPVTFKVDPQMEAYLDSLAKKRDERLAR